ncbi:hypothetical protein BKA83DRAFT_22854, partial [Pisolithus microcarpus]
ADGNAKFSWLSEEHGRLQQEVESQDRTIAQQRAALKHLQDEFRTLHAKLDCEIARTEKDSELAALTQNFSHIWTEKEAELVALAQKFEGALHQVKALNWSQQLPQSMQTHVPSMSSATPHPISRFDLQEEVGQDVEGEPCHAHMPIDTERTLGVPPREVTAGSVAEEVIQMLRMDTVGCLYSTPCCKVNSRKHHQLAVVKEEIMSDKEWNDNLASDFLLL